MLTRSGKEGNASALQTGCGRTAAPGKADTMRFMEETDLKLSGAYRRTRWRHSGRKAYKDGVPAGKEETMRKRLNTTRPPR